MLNLRPYQLNAVKETWEALKKDDNPVLLMASVGAGKSLMLADILLRLQNKGKLALCIVNNAELVRNNCQTFVDQGGKASIYCAALGEKDDSQPVIFGTPQSILNAIKKNEPLSKIPFNMLVVDEAHNIDHNNHRSLFMRILRHYKQQYQDMRLLGATGTNFRFKGTAIVGQDCLFKTQVGNITTEQLINDGYLIEPTFQIDPELTLDFSKVRIKSNGQFDHKELESVVEKSARLTELICKQVIHIMETQQRRGVFFFATTKKHAFEILSHLPISESAIILGETPQDERTRILNDARTGKIKYLVNIAIISVGVDVPPFDTLAYLRPTESLVLLVQTMGRVLRLSDKTGKKDAVVLDFAGNIERHRDWDNPTLLKAVAQTIDKDKPLVIICPACQALNTEHARRCIGVINSKRCDYFFEFKRCPNAECQAQNDKSSRHCRLCETEMIDPNAKLSLKPLMNTGAKVRVLHAKFRLSGTQAGGYRVSCLYVYAGTNGTQCAIWETFSPTSFKAKNVFYGKFVRLHCENASEWYPKLAYKNHMEKMLKTAQSPSHLLIEYNEGTATIKKKYFENQDEQPGCMD